MEQQVMCCSASIYFTCARGKMVLGQACAGPVPGLPGMGCGRCWRGEQAQPFQPHRWEAGLLLPRFLPRLGPQVPKGKLRLSSDAGEC